MRSRKKIERDLLWPFCMIKSQSIVPMLVATVTSSSADRNCSYIIIILILSSIDLFVWPTDCWRNSSLFVGHSDIQTFYHSNAFERIRTHSNTFGHSENRQQQEQQQRGNSNNRTDIHDKTEGGQFDGFVVVGCCLLFVDCCLLFVVCCVGGPVAYR